MELIDKFALVVEMKRLIKKNELYLDDVASDAVRFQKTGAYSVLCDLLHFLDTIEVKEVDSIVNPYDAYIQYTDRESAIKAHAEDYSWNIESELFQQLTPEQQKLWRKEIEQACISGGYCGLNLQKDRRYDDNLEVKEEQEEPVDVGTQIDYQNDSIKNLNSALNSMEHNGHLPKMMTAAESLGISEEEYTKIEDELFEEQEEPVRGDFEMALAEMIDKAQKCVVEPWVVAAQWKDELVKLAKECKAMQEHPKDCMYSKDNYTDEDRKNLCEGCEEDCKYNKKEEPASDGMEKELPKVWDRETLDEYAYQVAYDLSNDWMMETPTWNDVETACKLGAEWKERQMIELGMSVSNKAQKGE